MPKTEFDYYYGVEAEHFTSEQKREIIGILNESVIINNTEQYVTNAVKIYCRSVFDAIEENDVSLIRFYRVRNLKTEIK